MTEEHSDALHLVVVSHGVGEMAMNVNLQRVCSALTRRVPSSEVSPFLLSSDQSLYDELISNKAERTLILPLLFSRGYFFTQKIEREASRVKGRRSVDVLSPLIEWPEFHQLVVREVDKTETILGVAHGSKRSSNSRESAEHFFQSIAADVGVNRCCGFLEETPFAVDLAAQYKSARAVGLFLERGLHGGGDFEAVCQNLTVQPERHFIVGDVPDFPQMVCEKIIGLLDT